MNTSGDNNVIYRVHLGCAGGWPSEAVTPESGGEGGA